MRKAHALQKASLGVIPKKANAESHEAVLARLKVKQAAINERLGKKHNALYDVLAKLKAMPNPEPIRKPLVFKSVHVPAAAVAKKAPMTFGKVNIGGGAAAPAPKDDFAIYFDGPLKKGGHGRFHISD